MNPVSPKETHSSRKRNGKNGCSESERKYPCIVEIKIFLKAVENGEKNVRKLLGEILPEESIISISRRSSRFGKYHSFTCRFSITSEREQKKLHEHLSIQEQVLYLL